MEVDGKANVRVDVDLPVNTKLEVAKNGEVSVKREVKFEADYGEESVQGVKFEGDVKRENETTQNSIWEMMPNNNEKSIIKYESVNGLRIKLEADAEIHTKQEDCNEVDKPNQGLGKSNLKLSRHLSYPIPVAIRYVGTGEDTRESAPAGSTSTDSNVGQPNTSTTNGHRGVQTNNDPSNLQMANSKLASTNINKRLSEKKKKLYRCNVCNYSSVNAGNVKRHKRTHSGEKPYPCDQCDYSAAQSGDLEKHTFIHGGEKPHRCDECGYATVQASSLLVHKRVHSGERPYRCDVCKYSCASTASLKAHKRRHAGNGTNP